MDVVRNISQLLDTTEYEDHNTKGTAVPEKEGFAARIKENEGQQFCISLGGHTIRINSMYSETYSMCQKFLVSSKEPELTVDICEKDLVMERKQVEMENIDQSDGYLETLAVYRKICKGLLDYDIFLMHGAVIATQGNAYLFTAKSGTGKTTHIRKWLRQLEDSYVVNGDKPLIKITENEAIACGTPWCGKEKMGTNCMIPLKAIVLMKRGNDNEIREISFSEAFTFLIQQTYQPDGVENMKKTLRLFSQLKSRVRFYEFIFNNMKDDCFNVAYEALTGENT